MRAKLRVRLLGKGGFYGPRMTAHIFCPAKAKVFVRLGLDVVAHSIREQPVDLEPGKRADFLVRIANPLEDIRNTTKLAAIYHGGRRISPAFPEARAGSQRLAESRSTPA